MSSSIDYFDCPKCGGNAYSEQDNSTCEVTHGCSDCDWDGEDIENDEIIKYKKITVGFVIQEFTLQDDKFVCIEQSFIAGDQVDMEDEDGDSVDIDVSKEVYQPFGMKQPNTKSDFEKWYENNKDNDGVQRHYQDVLEQNPDYKLTFKEWAQIYYKECVDI